MNAMIPTPSAPSPFQFEGSRLRWVLRDDEPWFVATDLAALLGYRDAANMLRNLDDDEKGTHNLSMALTELRVGVVSEPGVYHAINARRQVKKLSPEVQERIVRFQRWVNHEVLPAIRRTGIYVAPQATPAPVVDPMAMLQDLDVLIPLLANLAQRAKVAEAKVEAAAPAVAFHDALADTDGLWGLRAAGKALHQGPDTFIKWLRTRGDLYDLNGGPVPKETLTKRGLFEVAWEMHGGKPRPTTKLTGKGIVFYARELGVRPPGAPAQALLPGL
jgi:prophage antirepressor-like protein